MSTFSPQRWIISPSHSCPNLGPISTWAWSQKCWPASQWLPTATRDHQACSGILNGLHQSTFMGSFGSYKWYIECLVWHTSTSPRGSRLHFCCIHEAESCSSGAGKETTASVSADSSESTHSHPTVKDPMFLASLHSFGALQQALGYVDQFLLGKEKIMRWICF